MGSSAAAAPAQASSLAASRISSASHTGQFTPSAISSSVADAPSRSTAQASATRDGGDPSGASAQAAQLSAAPQIAPFQLSAPRGGHRRPAGGDTANR
jgi:hypothetical protein